MAEFGRVSGSCDNGVPGFKDGLDDGETKAARGAGYKPDSSHFKCGLIVDGWRKWNWCKMSECQCGMVGYILDQLCMANVSIYTHSEFIIDSIIQKRPWMKL